MQKRPPTDMRSLPRALRLDRRLEVVRLRESGCTYEEIAERTGLSRTGAFDICKRHMNAGTDALRDAASGRRTGEGRQLGAAQEAELRELICAHTPDELGLSDLLWTRAAAARLVKQRLALELPVRTLALYLSRWGLSPQRPIARVRAASAAGFERWFAREYAVIGARAKADGAEIHWGGEALLADGEEDGPRQIYAVTNKGEMRWRIAGGAIDSGVLIEFFRRLIATTGKPSFVILNELGAYRDAAFNAWLDAHARQIVAFEGPAVGPSANAVKLKLAEPSVRSKPGMATIKEVARRAGVTPTTVSNVLRERGRVGAATREQVLKAIQQEGYRPNLTARALVERRAPTLALMLSSITNPFYPEFALQVNLAAHRHDRYLLVCNTSHEADGGSRFLREVAGSLSQGVLVANQQRLPIDELKGVMAGGTPVVVCIWEHPDESPGIPCVAFDSRQAGALATEHLLKLGHRQIGALIGSPKEGIHRGRYSGYRAALRSARIPHHHAAVERCCSDSIDGGYQAASELLRARPELTALFVSNDLPAIGALNAAADLGLQVPRDLSVVGITNIELSRHARPALTTVAIPTAEMAAQGVELLLRLIEQPPGAPLVLRSSEPTLVVRASTTAPKRSPTPDLLARRGSAR